MGNTARKAAHTGGTRFAFFAPEDGLVVPETKFMKVFYPLVRPRDVVDIEIVRGWTVDRVAEQVRKAFNTFEGKMIVAGEEVNEKGVREVHELRNRDLETLTSNFIHLLQDDRAQVITVRHMDRDIKHSTKSLSLKPGMTMGTVRSRIQELFTDEVIGRLIVKEEGLDPHPLTDADLRQEPLRFSHIFVVAGRRL